MDYPRYFARSVLQHIRFDFYRQNDYDCNPSIEWLAKMKEIRWKTSRVPWAQSIFQTCCQVLGQQTWIMLGCGLNTLQRDEGVKKKPCPTWERCLWFCLLMQPPYGRQLNDNWKPLVRPVAVPWATACRVYCQEEKRAEWRMGSCWAIVFLSQLFRVVAIGLLLALYMLGWAVFCN